MASPLSQVTVTNRRAKRIIPLADYRRRSSEKLRERRLDGSRSLILIANLARSIFARRQLQGPRRSFPCQVVLKNHNKTRRENR